ncbi:hypothetical protein F5B20DRAFT_521844 [Whalleya microplaca]|nr:hypothetical protein F5B20DRAFT_521844 [Whalleya microplaca]
MDVGHQETFPLHNLKPKSISHRLVLNPVCRTIVSRTTIFIPAAVFITTAAWRTTTRPTPVTRWIFFLWLFHLHLFHYAWLFGLCLFLGRPLLGRLLLGWLLLEWLLLEWLLLECLGVTDRCHMVFGGWRSFLQLVRDA